MNDIALAVKQLARRVEDLPSEVRIWTTSSLASSLGVQAHLTTIADPVEAVAELGDLWVGQVAELLEDCPSRQAEVLRAAHQVVVNLLGAVSESAE